MSLRRPKPPIKGSSAPEEEEEEEEEEAEEAEKLLTNNPIMTFSRHYSIFSRTPKCPSSYPWGYAYPRLGITAVTQRDAKVQIVS